MSIGPGGRAFTIALYWLLRSHMAPDFPKTVIDTLAKRAAFLCSNPDCRVLTIGPNATASQTTIIGEAAHIYAARAGQARYSALMTDQARSDLSNGIWLCRNCHKRVDRDSSNFTAELLYLWREQHDEYVASSLGSQSDRARFELSRHILAQFDGYPRKIWRIAYDKAPAWEWRLTAELMRYLNAPLFRKLADIREGVQPIRIESLEDGVVLAWVDKRLNEMAEMVGTLTKIISRLNKAWGEHGEPGDVDEIHHTALLMRDSLSQIVEHEERLKAARVSPMFERSIRLMQNALGSQITKISRVPDWLDGIAQMAVSGNHSGTTDEPLVITETIEFTLPDGWGDQFSQALRDASAQLNRTSALRPEFPASWGCGTGMFILCILLVIAAYF